MDEIIRNGVVYPENLSIFALSNSNNTIMENLNISLLEQVKKAHNMVEVENILGQVTQNYLTLYAKTIRRNNGGDYRAWVREAIAAYRKEIARAKAEILDNIPARLRTCLMYKALVSAY